MKYFQQGDVLLKPVAKMPDGLVPYTAEGGRVLQHGETTGHMHKFDDNAAVDVFVRPDAEQRLLSNGLTIVPGVGKFVLVRESAYLRHEEHKPVLVPPGLYEMDLVREYDYDLHETRRVLD